MNKKRRNAIKNIVSSLEKTSDLIQSVIDEEQDCISNIPDNLQNSEKADAMEEAVSKLDDAYNDVCAAIDALLEIS